MSSLAHRQAWPGLRSGPSRFGPPALYALLSLVFFGGPVVAHPATTIIARDQIDSSLFMWFFAWWPHAILHGIDPFITHVMFVPEGFNLQWTTPMPGPSLLLSPVTLGFGPAVTYNLIQLAAPALSAWTAFLLCRYVTGRVGPSLVGGYVFGFSPFELAHLTGGPFLALVPLLPVLLLLVLRRLDGELSRRRFLIWMVLTLVGQFLISTEVLLGAILFAALTGVIAYGLLAPRRAELRAVAGLVLTAGAVAALVMSPFLLAFFLGRHYPPLGTFFSADPVSFIRSPSFLELPSHIGRPDSSASGETYLGIPLVLILVAFLWQERRSRVAWVAVTSVVLALIASLGPVVYLNGRYTSVPLPWRLLAGLPVLRYAIPVRFVLFGLLPAALIVATWLARGGSWGRWALAALVIVSFVPNIGNAAWHTHIRDPAFFADGAYRHYLSPTDRVLTVPTLGPNERWQAESGFRFTLAAGYAGAYPASYTRFPIWNSLITGVLTPGYAAQLRAFIAAKGVTAIVVDDSYPGPWRRLFATLGVRPRRIGGVTVYRLRARGRI